ncbi:MAG: hypothetical protein NC417_07150 [Candidatus Gastranaerophilales bacterium]|nr:hypothetical protein [Candidatus Gastranaerophilales bacterium]
MDRLAENQYKLNITKGQMKSLGFRYDHSLDAYIYKFPVYKCDKIPLIFCKLGIDEETHRIWFNVYDANDALYAPYYNNEYGENELIDIIERKIGQELKKLGVTRVY